MTRQEQIEQAAKKYVKDIVTPLPASLMTAFMQGAEWADAHPDLYSVTRKAVEREREYLIEKACDWLRASTILAETTIERFKKAMEEQQ